MAQVSEVESPDFDLPAYSGRVSKYILATQPRSGSHLLAALLRDTGRFGVPLEYFHRAHWQAWKTQRGQHDDRAALDLLLRTRTSSNGQFGAKAHWHQFAMMLRLDVEDIFRDAKFVYVSRVDLLGQAVSHTIALNTGVWHHGQTAVGEAVFSVEDIDRSVHFLLQERSRWERFFAFSGVRPFRLNYEDLLEDPNAEMRKLSEFLGVQWGGEVKARDGIQRTSRNAEWVDRYLAAKASQSKSAPWKSMMTTSGKAQPGSQIVERFRMLFWRP